MAPKAGKIAARTRVATFDIEGDSWEEEYRPFSRDVLREVMQGDEGEQLDQSIDLLSHVVQRWNLEDDDGKPKGFDADWLRAVGLDYVGMLLTGLLEDQRNPKASLTPSSN